METTYEPTPNARVQLSPRASQQISALSGEDYLRYEDALVELSVRLAMGEVPSDEDMEGDEHILEYAGCTLLFKASGQDSSVLVRRVFCNRDEVPAERLPRFPSVPAAMAWS